MTSKIFLAVAIIVDPADHSSADARGLRGGDQRCPDGNNAKPLLLGYASLSHDSDNQCRHFLGFPPDQEGNAMLQDRILREHK